jgi:hypothetical protein
MRNMSFSMTTEQYRNRTKSVTRRFGWSFLKPGDVVMGVEKAMGLRKGESIVKLHPMRVLLVTPEPLSAIREYPNDAALEGFPDWTPDQFIDFLCKKSGKKPDAIVNRIWFEHLEG